MRFDAGAGRQSMEMYVRDDVVFITTNGAEVVMSVGE